MIIVGRRIHITYVSLIDYCFTSMSNNQNQRLLTKIEIIIGDPVNKKTYRVTDSSVTHGLTPHPHLRASENRPKNMFNKSHII